MKSHPVFIISGDQGEGKTTMLTEVVSELVKKDIGVHGFLAPGVWKAGLRSDFYIQDLVTGNQQLLCKSIPEKGFEKIGRFYFNPDTIAFGEDLLRNNKPGDLLIIDEVGMFEIKGQVWNRVLKEVIEAKENPLLITVRKEFVDDVISVFNLSDPLVYHVSDNGKDIADKIIDHLKK
jgi:nucleoside-triphosphatase